MATWLDLMQYVRSNYKIADEQPGIVKMIFEMDNLRTQVVFLSRHTLMNGEEEWLLVESPFAEVNSVNLGQALEYVGDIVCGGLALTAGHLTIRHAVPLANLNVNEFERPLMLVTSSADRLEHSLTGSDKY